MISCAEKMHTFEVYLKTYFQVKPFVSAIKIKQDIVFNIVFYLLFITTHNKDQVWWGLVHILLFNPTRGVSPSLRRAHINYTHGEMLV